MGHRLGVLVAALLLTAGCNVFPGSAGGGVEPTATLTPVPVTAENPTPASTPVPESVLPPGISPNGSIDIKRLARAHDAVLANRSYTWEYRQKQVEESTSNVSITLVRRVEVGQNATFVVDEQSLAGTDDVQRVSRYLTDRSGYLREERGGSVTQTVLRETRGERNYAPMDDFLRSFLVNRTVNVRVVERDGQRLVQLYAPPGPSPEGLFALRDRVSEFTVTAYITPDGFVQTAIVSYESGGLSPETQRVTIRAEYSDVGTTTITRPDWVDPTETVTPTSDGTATPTSDGTATPTRTNATVTD